jgi:hypothetical protein
VQVITNGAHYYFSRVESHTQAQFQSLRATHRLRIVAHGCLHGQGGIAGTQGVVLVGDRSAKQGHNAIAQHLIDGALKAVHCCHHVLEGGIEELLGGFWVEATDELGGVFDIGKEHRYLFAFTSKSNTRGKDFVSEMCRRIDQRRLLHPHRYWRCGRCTWRDCVGAGRSPSRPDQHRAVLVHGHLLHLDEFGL